MKYLAVGFALFILAVIVAADMGVIGPYLKWLTFFGGDKLGHFLLFGMLSLFVNLALFQSLPGRDPTRVVVISCLILALVIGAEELSQNIFSTRTFSWLDLTASYLGVALFSLLSLKIRNTHKL